ncbi:hypothetical protein CH300_00300 [Rhodococcus sp. 15-1154-1]|nr:hypothetical protein [Rhodococcus sp. 15-1154-1]OZF09857.1 hypothetical protein CH300_00300 [Rhodococcus sp. 15-1154-1]
MSEPTFTNDVRAYLQIAGWREISAGAAGEMWQYSEGDDGPVMMGLPYSMEPKGFEYKGLVERVARIEKRSQHDVDRRLRYFGFDITNLRAANDYRIADTISLDAGATMTESARLMVRSSATTAEGPRVSLRGNYSTSGDSYARAARMGHTQHGSYIIPVMIRVGSSESRQKVREESLFDEVEVPQERAIESPERRVTRTFSEAFASVVDHIVQPARDPRASDIDGIVASGVTREFVQALHRIISHPDVAQFDAEFSWAPSQQPAPGAILKRSCPSDAAELLDSASKLMTHTEVKRSETLTGKIVEVRHQESDPFVYVSISTVRSARVTEVRITQPAAKLTDALDWWKDARTVAVQGEVQRASRGFTIRAPQYFKPIESLFD